MELLIDRKHYPPRATQKPCQTVLEVVGYIKGTIREAFLEDGEFALEP